MFDTFTHHDAQDVDFPTLCDGFMLTSPWRSLATQGRFATLSLPVADAADLKGGFQRLLRQHFQAARQHGIADPVLVGAIPFDVSQPAALFIPESHRFFDRNALLAASPVTHDTLPEIKHREALPGEEAFRAMVTQAVEAMQRGELDKVVLSRLLDIVTHRPVDTASLMQRVVAQNPTAWHFHVPLPQGGALIGASPELMVRKAGMDFSSCPLAGSAARSADRVVDRESGEALMNSHKDRHEHQVVTHAMRDVLRPVCRTLSVPDAPSLLTTSTLWHLATQIEGSVSDPAENALSLACRLHPTPALSGFPQRAARELLTRLEPFERELFGGIVGWCDAAGNGEWVVTIRCGVVSGTRVRLFAGAGIVAQSQPESEWRETGVKLNTMLRAFGLQERNG